MLYTTLILEEANAMTQAIARGDFEEAEKRIETIKGISRKNDGICSIWALPFIALALLI